MSLFAIGDPHLSFSTDKPMDIFKGWDDYVLKLENNWNSIVTDEDTVIIPGDISWAMGLESAKKDFEFINNLNGNKIILKGNHDYWWNTMNKMNKFLEENEFDSIKILHNNSFIIGNVGICGTRGWFYEESRSGEGRKERNGYKTSSESPCCISSARVYFVRELHYDLLC